ncbi:MAG: hypothetical protein ACKVUS_03505 [Saprospiraceae bacterium]
MFEKSWLACPRKAWEEKTKDDYPRRSAKGKKTAGKFINFGEVHAGKCKVSKKGYWLREKPPSSVCAATPRCVNFLTQPLSRFGFPRRIFFKNIFQKNAARLFLEKLLRPHTPNIIPQQSMFF